MHQHSKIKIFAAFIIVAIALPVAQAADPLRQAFPDFKAARGLVLAGPSTPVESIVELAKSSPTVVLVLMPDMQSRNQIAAKLRDADVYGQVTTQLLEDQGGIPLSDGVVRVVIVDPSKLPGLAERELLRVTRPDGEIWRPADNAWKRSVKPRPEGMDGWTHYHYDATNSEASQDTLVGPPLGIQWIAGPSNEHDFVLINGEVAVFISEMPGQQATLIAREAETGLPLWKQGGLVPVTRFAMVLGDKYLFIHRGGYAPAPFTEALDRYTGEKKIEYSEGIDFTVTKAAKKQRGWRAAKDQAARAEDLQLRLADGVLLQATPQHLVALDAETGKRLWRKDTEGEFQFAHPAIEAGTLYFIKGRAQRASAYTHWPMAKPDQIFAVDLKTGKEKWRFTWDQKKMGSAHGMYNMQVDGQYVGGAVTIIPDEYVKAQATGKKMAFRPKAHGLILNSTNGEIVFFGRQDDPKRKKGEIWPHSTGGGHSHVRMHFRNGRAWVADIGSPRGSFAIKDPDEVESFIEKFSQRGQGFRPVSCTVWRSTPKYWIGGVATYPIEGDGLATFNQSSRSGCDIGAFPANGLIYIPPFLCHCKPYLPGTKAYHSRTYDEVIPDDLRLEQGTGKPAAAGDLDGWPQWRGGPARRGWAEFKTPVELKQAWRFKTPTNEPTSLLRDQWVADAVIEGPLTTSTVMGSTVVTAAANRQEVIALDAATGEVKWRADVNGRIDMAPSIFRGGVYVGTRNGWVYSFNLNDGRLMWRFMAAPQRHRILVNGQLESPWPIFGAVPVDEHGVLAIAGRHTTTDGGLWWWLLDPTTGEIKSKGRLGEAKALRVAANWEARLPVELRSIQNSVPVVSDSIIELPTTTIKRVNGAPDVSGENGKPRPKSFFGHSRNQVEPHLGARIVRVGMNAMVGEPVQLSNGWNKAYFANTLARMFAIEPDGKRFVSVGGGLGTAVARGGGGGSKVELMRLLDGKPRGRKTDSLEYADVVWTHSPAMFHRRGPDAVRDVAVSENAVYLAVTPIRHRGDEDMPEHFLRVLDLESGKVLVDMLALPAAALNGGIALSPDRVLVTCNDGSVVCLTDQGR